MRTLLRAVLFALVVVATPGLEAGAQIFRPGYLRDGYPEALQKARDTLAADAYLVFAGTFGDLDLEQFGFPLPVTLNFYQDTIPRSGIVAARYPGQADAWGYVFNSPSMGATVSLVAFNAPLLGGWSVQGVPVELPLPARLVDTLDLAVAGNRSDTAMLRLRRNPTWREYHARYPVKQPSFVTLGTALPVGIEPPSDFPLAGTIWSFTYSRSRDTAGMVCFVNGSSGATSCRVLAISSAPVQSDGAGLAMRALPNPSTGRVRVVIDGHPALRGDVTLELLDARGAYVANLTSSLLANDLRHAELDASMLPAGIYFVRLGVDGATTLLALNIGSR